MRSIVEIGDPSACERDLTGGKGANLARMAQANFPVPRAFIVTTAAYAEVFRGDCENRIGSLIAAIDFEHAASVEEGARRIRELVMAVEPPAAIVREIEGAYAKLGSGRYVAVRSSGTAEDMAEASFAGRHDTYLDISGTAAVLDAIRRCWASLWTARAVAYRHAHRVGIDRAVRLAVVVQEMVEAEVAGVLFTANPLTRATDEIVINAAWGLGEGVVSGVLTPDQISVHKRTRQTVSVVTGSKEIRIVRNPATGQGTVEQPNSEDERRAQCLNEAQVAELAALGLEVERHYGGMPQDIEWAFAAGRFHLLQARDVTGVEFSWDEEADAWQTLPEEPATVWTRGFADEYWTGAITPLFYSVRACEHTASYHRTARLWGIPSLERARIFRFRESEAYFSARNQATQIQHFLPKSFRVGAAIEYLPPSMRAAAVAAPFSWLGYLYLHARIRILNPKQGIRGWLEAVGHYMAHRVPEAEGLDDAALRRLSDNELRRYTDAQIKFMEELLECMWSGFQIHGAGALYLLGAVLARWYDGDNTMVYADLITGLPRRTITMEENLALWDLAAEIRREGALRELFRTSDEKSFFEQLERHPSGGRAAALYRDFVRQHGHRGHADRDFYYPRRIEDPGIDYRALKALLSGGGAERPDRMEHRLVARREAAVTDVEARLRRRSFGGLRVAAFRALHRYVLDFLVLRDDERHYVDRVTMSKKRAFIELARRLCERGVLARGDDFYFLTRAELYDALETRGSPRLIAAKIAGRRRQFDRFHTKQYIPPLYLRGREVFHDAEAGAAPQQGDVLRGMPTSRGCVTGRARIVLELGQIGTLEQGDILVTNSTDPGWTPVFALIGGLVLETGGMLAHGACLSREYNLPAVTIPNASKLIADGDRVTLDGNTGELRIEQAPRVAATH